MPEGALDDVRSEGPIGFFPNSDIWASRIAGDGIVLIGDAAGSADPTQGHGTSLLFRDVRELSEILIAERDWAVAVAEFEVRRRRYYDVILVRPMGEPCNYGVGDAADRAREGHKRAKQDDPTLGGFGVIEGGGRMASWPMKPPDASASANPCRRPPAFWAERHRHGVESESSCRGPCAHETRGRGHVQPGPRPCPRTRRLLRGARRDCRGSRSSRTRSGRPVRASGSATSRLAGRWSLTRSSGSPRCPSQSPAWRSLDTGRGRQAALDNTAARYIPEPASVEVFAGVEDGRVRLVPLDRPITIFDLLTHTSGLRLSADPGARRHMVGTLQQPRPGLPEFIRRLAAQPLAHQPGAPGATACPTTSSAG